VPWDTSEGMIKTLLRIYTILFLSCSVAIAQGEYRYSAPEKDLSQWTQLIYAEHPDTGAVISAYEKYYETHAFEKNTHTQYYKRWIRGIARQQSTDGRTAADQRYLAQRNEEKNALRSTTTSWVSVGPWDWDHDAVDRSYAPGAAHVYVVEQSQSNPDILYAGTATTGIWKTVDHGLNWSPVTFDMLVNGLTTLEINHSNPDVVYGEMLSSIYKTTDGGSIWIPTGNSAFQNLSLNTADIVMHPTDSAIVWAATDSGLYRTTDGGQTWSSQLAGDILEIEFHPIHDDTIYTVLRNGDVTEFYRSVNGGTSFIQQASGWPAPDLNTGEQQKRTEIAVSLDDPDLVIALATGSANGGSGLYGVYKSRDAGVTWNFECCGPQPAGEPSASNPNLMGWSDLGLDDGGQYYYDLALDISPTNADSIFVAGVNLWISGDGGASFVCPAKWSQPYKPGYVHADIHDIHYYANTGEIWIGCDGGIFFSDDNGDNFARRMNGITGSDFWGFGAGFRDGDIMLGGTYHNGTLLKDNDTYLNGWLCTDGGDNYRGFVHPVLQRQVFSDYNIKELSGDREINNVTRGYSRKPNATYTTGRSSDVLFHPLYYDTWYSGSDSSLWKTEDNGYTFTEVHKFDGKVAAMDLCFADPDVMCAATFPGWWDTKRIYRTEDAGESWVEITPPSAMLNGNLWVPFDIAVSALDPDKIWIVRTSMYGGTNMTGAVVFYSDDGGSTWTNITSNLPADQACTNIAHHLGSDGGVYIGTRRGVYYRNDTMSDWQLYSAGLPASSVSVRLIPYYEKQTIRNGTNRSVWERDLMENAAPIAQGSVAGRVMRCLSDTVRYYDHSVISDQNANWTWTFPGGTPATSTDRDPKVMYTQPGIFDVTLEVSDDYGSDMRTFPAMIKVVNECRLDSVPGLAMKTIGNADYAIVSDMAMTVDSFTIAAWVKPDGIQDDYSAVVMNDGTTAGLNFRGGNNTLGYHWPGGSWSWNSNLVVPQDVWSHVAIVVTTSQVRLYLNGIEAVHNTSPDTVLLGTMKIGSYKGWSSRNYKGLIDEVSMYDRALTKEEIRSLRHLTLKPSDDTSLVAYYQFNEEGGIVYNKAGEKDALLNGTAGKVRSRAPLGSGVSQYMDVSTTGIYAFENVGLTLDFQAGSVVPDGDLFISRLGVSPDTVRQDAGRLHNGYWILNNYGVNDSLQSPIVMTFDPIGFVSDSMVASSQPLLLVRPANAEVGDWLNMGKFTEIFSGVNGSLFASGFDNYIPGQVMLTRDSFPVGTPMISVGVAGYIANRRGGMSVAFDLSTGSSKGLGLPVLTADELEELASPQAGMLAYHIGEKALCFFNDSTWILVDHDYIDILPLTGTDSVVGFFVDSQATSSAILALGGGGLVLPNSMTDNEIVDIDFPPMGLVVYRSQSNEFVLYDGAEWRSLRGVDSGLTVNANSPSTSHPGIAVGIIDKSPGAVLQISSSDKGLGVPVANIAMIRSPVEGLLVFDPVQKSLCFFDGVSWQRAITH
jgi:photosystem II stability/assembly factor-like uncharacterized protein/PKD repeat protein